jgi:glycosyltransferase involved in cell wall biosynthesis
MAGCAAFVLPSLYEGFGLPILEAMASGVPVVTSRGGALEEVAGDAAILVDPLDVEAIAAAIERALDDTSLRETLVQKGLARAAQFSWERTAKATLRVYEQAIAGRR